MGRKQDYKSLLAQARDILYKLIEGELKQEEYEELREKYELILEYIHIRERVRTRIALERLTEALESRMTSYNKRKGSRGWRRY